MTKLRFLLFAIALAFLAALAGCRDSSKTTSATPAATPTPAPGQLVEVKPPASIAAGQISPSVVTKFAVQGNAGQYLRVEATGEENNSADRPSIVAQLQGKGAEFDSISPDNCDDWLYALPQSGTYHLAFHPAGRRSALRFSLLESSDPLLAAGIKTEEISVDFGVFAQNKDKKISTQPYEMTCDVGESWPAHVLVESGPVSLRIMQVAGYQELFRRDTTMALLQSALRTKEKDANPKNLPFPFDSDSALELSTGPHYLEGSGWSGIRWIGFFAQDSGCDFDPKAPFLEYVFEGISNDGRFFILMRASISSPETARKLRQDCTAGKQAIRKQNRNEDVFFEKDMPVIFARDINAAGPASFQPRIAQLDEAIRSLKLK